MIDFIDWDEVPEVMSKEQFYQICHISKTTAGMLLKSGKVPSEYCSKPRCYKIKKQDVMKYLENRVVFPNAYSAPKGWYSGTYENSLPKDLPESDLKRMRNFYENLLMDCPDILTTMDVVKLTGYGKSTVNDWCNHDILMHFRKSYYNHIPKRFLIDFFCSLYFRSITRKTKWHLKTLSHFEAILREEKSREWWEGRKKR